ncbi:hypothetical protein L915_10233, partial [Phytophthora nicotianae]
SALASRLRELATSHRAAQAEVARLEAAIKHKNGRLRTLNDNYERRLRVADTTIATHRAELVRLQDQVSTPNWDLQKASQRVQAVTSQRDQAKAAHIVTQDRVSAARDNIARLEKRISQVEKSQKTRQDLESALATLQQEKDALAVKRDELLGQLGERFVETGGGGVSSSPAAPEAGAPSDDGESSSGESSSTRVFDSDAAGSVSTSPELNRAKNEFGMPSGPLSDTELAALQPTTVLRSEWIPGYRDHRSFRGHDIVPWSAQDIRQISIVEMDADLLFHR